MSGARAATRRLILLSILNHSAFAGSRVVVSLSGLELKASPFAIGLMLSFYSLLPAFLSVSGGRWIDRVGLQRPMLVGTAGVVFGVVIPFLAWDIGALFLAPVCIGLSFTAFHLASQKAIGDAASDAQRRLNFSQFALGFSISGFVGPTGAGLLIDLVGHRLTFGLLALLPLITLIVLQRRPFTLRHPAPKAAGAPTAAAGAAAGTAAGAEAPERSVLDLLREPELKRLFVAVVVVSSSWDVHQFLVPLYGAQLGLSASSIGLVLGAFSVATFVIRAALPLLARRLGEWPLILGAISTAAVVYAIYPFFPTLPAMLAMSFALGLGLGMSQPMVMSVLHRAAPPDRIGEAGGLRLTLVNFTQTVLPTGFGLMGGALGLAPMFWGMAVLVGGGAWFASRGLRAPNRTEVHR